MLDTKINLSLNSMFYKCFERFWDSIHIYTYKDTHTRCTHILRYGLNSFLLDMFIYMTWKSELYGVREGERQGSSIRWFTTQMACMPELWEAESRSFFQSLTICLVPSKSGSSFSPYSQPYTTAFVPPQCPVFPISYAISITMFCIA